MNGSAVSVCLLLMYKRDLDLYKVLLYPDRLLNLLTLSRSFLVHILGSLMDNTISSKNGYSLTSFSICRLFFSCYSLWHYLREQSSR